MVEWKHSKHSWPPVLLLSHCLQSLHVWPWWFVAEEYSFILVPNMPECSNKSRPCSSWHSCSCPWHFGDLTPTSGFTCEQQKRGYCAILSPSFLKHRYWWLAVLWLYHSSDLKIMVLTYWQLNWQRLFKCLKLHNFGTWWREVHLKFQGLCLDE